MSGLLLAVGDAARPELLHDPIATRGWTEAHANVGTAIVAVSADVETAFSPDGSIFVAVLGYTVPGARHLAGLVSQLGFSRALAHLDAGGYAVVMVNIADGTCMATRDRFATIPLYYARTDGGVLVCSTPVALGRSPMVDRTADLAGMAEWLRFGHTIGDRYLIRGVRLLSIGDMLHWDGREASAVTIDTTLHDAARDRRDADPHVLTDLVESACARLQTVDPAPGHLQSAGFDSRFLLACWPEGYDPVCFTYGDPSAIEPSIAAQVAAVRGSRHVHQFATADQVTASLDAMFEASGVMVFPDRYIIARTMRADGQRSVLDGFLGDVLIGNGSERGGRFLGRISRFARRLGVWMDGRVSQIGLDRLSEWLFAMMTEPSYADCRAFLADEFVAVVEAQRSDILHDIRAELARWHHASDSLEITLQNFALNNRSAHSTLQQAVACRESVRVMTPFADDRALTDYLLSLHLSTKAARRLYRAAFVQRKTRYAAVPWGLSLLPISKPLIQHQVSAAAIGRGLRVPGVTGVTGGRERDPNGWALWLKNGAGLRETAAEDFDRAGIGQKGAFFSDLASGQARGSGKLFHAASVARWYIMAEHSRADARTSHPGLAAPGVDD